VIDTGPVGILFNVTPN